MNQIILILPEIFLSITAFGVLLGEAFFPGKKRLWLVVATAALKVTLLYLILFFVWGGGTLGGILWDGTTCIRSDADSIRANLWYVNH